MSAAHIHLILNHVPVLGLAAALLLLVWGLSRHSRELLRIALVAVVIVAAITVPVFLSGESAEENLEGMAAFPESRMEAHEEAAERALAAVVASGLFALLALALLRRGGFARRVSLGATVIFSIVALGLAAIAANTGARIHHDEIGESASAVITSEESDD